MSLLIQWTVGLVCSEQWVVLDCLKLFLKRVKTFVMNVESLRLFVNASLHDPRTRVSRFVNGFVVFLIVFSVAVVPLHFLPGVGWIEEPLYLFDRVVVTVFTVEYLLRIWSARKPFRYLVSWWGLIDLVAILPFYLAQFELFAVPEVFLMLRILRILKLGKAYDMERLAILDCREGEHGAFRLTPGERIERVVQKHPVVLLVSLIFPLFFTSAGLFILVFFDANNFALAVSLLFFFFAVIFFLKAWLDYNYDVIYITNYRVVLQNRELFGVAINDVSYEAITNVVPSNLGILHWLLGFGNIQIETASSVGVFHFHDSSDPHEVVQHISLNRQKTFDAKVSGGRGAGGADPHFPSNDLDPGAVHRAEV